MDMIIKGYMDENAKAMRKVRDLEQRIKSEVGKNQNYEKELNTFKLKNLKERNGIFEDDDQVTITTGDDQKSGDTISLKQLQELRDTLKRLQTENDSLKWGNAESDQVKELSKKLD